MVIAILYSEAGCGKTYQSLTAEEPILEYDMENRVKKKIEKYYPDKLITLLELKKYDAGFNEDKIESFNAFKKETINLIKLPEGEIPRTVIIDGIGDLRDYAHAVWGKIEKRKKAMNPGDWSQVNDLVRDALFPLINWSRVHDTNLIMTAQMKDNYTVVENVNGKQSVKDGRVPSFKEFCQYNVDCIIELWQPKVKGKIKSGSYMATCSKSEVGSWEEDISNKNLWDILIDKGMV